MTEHVCDDCGTAVPPPREPALPGLKVAQRCAPCGRKARITHLLCMLPDEDDGSFEALTAWEQAFLPSVREQFEKRGSLSDAQLEALERIYAKV